MGVDISTWRARVGMFIPKTSQNSLLIFSAQAHSRLPNNDQAPGSIPENSIQSPQTDIRDAGSMLKGHQKLNSTHPVQKEYSYVASILFSCICHLLLILSISLIDTPSELRLPSSHPYQNETSHVQLSYVQLLMILMCGDVEVNPGPPSKYKERAEKLTEFTVPVEDVIYPEYCSNLKVDFTLKNKDPGYLEQMEDIVQTACAMLNYAGGVITLNPKTASTAGDENQRNEWAGKIQEKLELVVQKEVLRCIEIKLQSGYIEIWLRKSWKFITYNLPLYVRRGNGTHDGDISMISGNVITKPSLVLKNAKVQWNQLNHGDRFPLSEGMNLEYKCYIKTCDATSLMDRITKDEIRGEPKLIKTLLAFTNTEGGGDAIIGIKEVKGAPILEGQKLSEADKEIVRRRFDELMIKGLNGEQRIWPATPQSGSEWTINFYPLRNCPHNDRRVLIHIRVNQVAGYVLGDEPEAYTMTPEGNIRHVPLNEWKKCINPTSNKSAPELLKLGSQSKEQDKDDDDMDEEQFQQLVDALKKHRVTLSLNHIKSASWTKDSEDTQDDILPGVNMETCVEEVSKSDLLRPSSPSTWVPDKTILDRWVMMNHPDMKECVDAIAKSHSQETVVIGTKFFGHLFPRLSLEVPQHHAFDFLEIQGDAQTGLWIVFDDCSDIVACKKYANSAIRILRSLLLSHMHQHTVTKADKLAISAKVWSIADNCIKYESTQGYYESTVELSVLQKAVAHCLLGGQSHIKNRLGEEYLIALTKDQLSGRLVYPYTNVVFQGPPGSGKSIIAQHLCEHEAKNRNLDKDEILYICPCQPLADFINFQGRCHAKFTKTEELVNSVKEALGNRILLVIIDDAHLFLCSKDEWFEILKQFKSSGKGSTARLLAVFLDPKYQNFQDDKAKNLDEAIDAINGELYSQVVHVYKAKPVVIRNSRGIFHFFKTNAEGDTSALTCAHDFQGDGMSVTYTLGDFFHADSDNPVIKLAKEIVGLYNFEENFTYKETDITILVDADGKGNAEQAVQELYGIFIKFYPEAKIQRASDFPVQGIVIEELTSFSGLDTRVCILVLTCKDTSVMDDPRYKCFVASRGITKLVFLLHGDTVDSSFRQLKFSEEEQWQKLTKQLLKEIPEKGSSDAWLKKNVPDTECWYKTKSFVMMTCQKQIKVTEDYTRLAGWMESNISPALRQDAQLVRAVIGSVCEKTMRQTSSGYEVDLKENRSLLGALNCLYGAPESFQHQALDSVYDHVESLKHPEKILHKVLDMMWSDGFISRQAIQSWFDNMEQTKRQTHEINMQGKDLGEQIQERMRTRQEVRIWIRATTQLGNYWYNSPHYKRVALHALCQLAVTWQGDKCTVDKHLILFYIPQLFCDTWDGLQLLYAVQCVLHHLQNPPGLAMAVLQALGTIKTVITPTDWDKWRNTQNPVYDEGRIIIQEQKRILDLMVLASSEVTLTEINVWISDNIPHDQMMEAFITAAECLLTRQKEVTLIWDWISQNVPQSMETAVQDTLRATIISRCLQRVKFPGISNWMVELPGWRHDAQFVKAVIQAVCERTMHSSKIDSKELASLLGVLNCLYDAPKALQLQALDAVYDHIRTLQHHEKVLQEVLDIMWHDGYISRQVMLSWSHDKKQTSVIPILTGSKKDLRERIQERMRAGQEVRRWMEDATQLDYYWYDSPHYQRVALPAWYDSPHYQRVALHAWNDSPHYQRVALHALCQLAVTWQDDKCTVDKDLLLHYIPQLFSDTWDGLQLLYAVQCVLCQLTNPPGLAETVLEVLVSSSTDRPCRIITESHLEKWRKTEHKEGRESMRLALTNLNV